MLNLKKYQIAIIFCFLLVVSNSFAQDSNNEDVIDDLQIFCSNQKGFNLLGKFDVAWSNTGFTEKEFQVIHDLGFNFVRLPLDYRTYTLTNNWNYFVEARLKEIDKAIEWGIKYDVHVCINLHRAPGFCVNSSILPVNQQLDLWTDTIAQNTFLKHWELFANRYKDISPQRLSFNLVNEPKDVSESVYVGLMKKAIQNIHNISPNRVVFVDGLNYGNDILLSLKDEANVAQSIHSYSPFTLTHYKANWVDGSDDWPVPQWPIMWVSTYLYGPWKSEFKSALVLKGNFAEGTEVTVNVAKVSVESTLQIKADNTIVLKKAFKCGPDLGTDFTKIVETEWGYQNISNKDFSATLSKAATSLSIENSDGDWMTINSITIKQGEVSQTFLISDGTWGKKQETYTIDENGVLKTEDGNNLLPFKDYQEAFDLANENNIPFMVQEFGVHNKTPHKVTVDFLSDLGNFFEENNVGWALWNLTGSFGILNSSRSDCSYESYEGWQLDRGMLDALTKSTNTSSFVSEKENGFKLFPSPAENELFFLAENFDGLTQFRIYDLTGSLQKAFDFEVIENETISLDITGIKTGMYILSATNSGKNITRKFLIK